MEPFVTRIGDVTIERVLPKSDRAGAKDFKEVPASPTAPKRGSPPSDNEGIPVNEDLQIFMKPPSSDSGFDRPPKDGDGAAESELEAGVVAPPKPSDASDASDMSTDGEETDNEESEMEGEDADAEAEADERTKHDSDGEVKSQMEDPELEHHLERTESFDMCSDKGDPMLEGGEESANIDLNIDIPDGESCDSNKRKAPDGSSLSPGVGGQKKKKSGNDSGKEGKNGSSSDSEDSQDGDSKTMVERKLSNMRRNIREVMSENQLDEETLAAQRQEMERLRRVQEQQRIIREVQRQIAMNRQNNKTQNRVISILQGNSSILKQIPGASGTGSGTQVKLPNTVLVKLSSPSSSSTTTTTNTGTQGNKKQLIEFLRVQKSLSSGRTISQAGVTRSLVGSKQRAAGQVHMMTPSVSIAPVTSSARQQQQDLPTDSDSDDDYESDSEVARAAMRKVAGKPKGKVTISSSSDDDCILLSEPSSGDEEPVDDPTNSGMHTNDMYNIPDEQGRVLVNVGHPAEDEDIFIAPQIARVIKPHQIGGVRFLFDNVVESVSRFNTSTGFGCILAHSMGLGKTLQVVCFCDIFLRHTSGRTVLCIMPINTLQNWMAEFNMWLPREPECSESPLATPGDIRHRNFPLHVLNDSHKTMAARARVIRDWSKDGGVLLIGYELYRQLSLKRSSKTKKGKRRKSDDLFDSEGGGDEKTKLLLDDMHTALVKPGPDLVICDEGHRIKNSHASISQALKQIRSKRRVVLTGYPLQNNLLEYWCMVDFVRPNYLGTKTEFCNMFERPIQNGQCIDSTPQDIRLMRYRAHVLHSLLEGFVQRRSHSVLQVSLPQKEEYVLLLRMTNFQRTLYDTFMNEVVRTKAVPNPLKAFAVCCKIWNHPDILYYFLKKRNCGEDVDLDLEEATAAAAAAAATPGTPVGTANVGSPVKSGSMPKKPRGRALKTPQPKKEKKPPAFRQTNSSKKPAATITPNTMNSISDNASSLPGSNLPFTSPSNQMQTDIGQQNMHVDMQQQNQNFGMLQQQQPYDGSQYQNMSASSYHQGTSNPSYVNQDYGQISNSSGYSSNNYGNMGQYSSNGSYNNCLDPNNPNNSSGYNNSSGNSYYPNNSGNQQTNYGNSSNQQANYSSSGNQQANYNSSVGYSNYQGNSSQSGYHCDASINNTGTGYWQGSDYFSQSTQSQQNPSNVVDQYYGGSNTFGASGNSSYYSNESYGEQISGGSFGCQNTGIFQNIDSNNSMGCSNSQNFVGDSGAQKNSPSVTGSIHQNHAPANLDNSLGAHNMKNQNSVANSGNMVQNSSSRYNSTNLAPNQPQETSQSEVGNVEKNSMDSHCVTSKNLYSGQQNQTFSSNVQQNSGSSQINNQRGSPSGQMALQQDAVNSAGMANSNMNMQHNTDNLPQKNLLNVPNNMLSQQANLSSNNNPHTSVSNAIKVQQNALSSINAQHMNPQQNPTNSQNSQQNIFMGITGQQNSMNTMSGQQNLINDQQNMTVQQIPMNNMNAQQNTIINISAQQTHLNSISAQQNPVNIASSQHNPMNNISAHQNPITSMNTQQNSMNSQQNTVSGLNHQQQTMNLMNPQQNMINIIDSQQNSINVMNAQQNHVNAQRNIIDVVNPQQNNMNGMNVQQNHMSGMISQQNHGNGMIPEQNHLNPRQIPMSQQNSMNSDMNIERNPVNNMNTEQSHMNNLNSVHNSRNGLHTQQNPMTTINVQQSSVSASNSQQNSMNSMSSQQTTTNSMNSQQNSINMNTSQSPNSANSHQSSMNMMSGQQNMNPQHNPMNSMNAQQDSLNSINSQQGSFNNMNPPQSLLNRIDAAPQGSMNSMNSQQGAFNGMNLQQGSFNSINAQRDSFDSMNPLQGSLESMNAQHGSVNNMNPQQNPMGSMNVPQNPMNMNMRQHNSVNMNSQQTPINTSLPHAPVSGLNAQQNTLNSYNAQQNSINNLNSQQSLVSSMAVQHNPLNSMNVLQNAVNTINAHPNHMNIQQNAMSCVTPQQSAMSHVNVQQNAITTMGAQQNSMPILNAQPNSTNSVNAQNSMNNSNPQNSVNIQQTSFNNLSVQQSPMNNSCPQKNPLNTGAQQQSMNTNAVHPMNTSAQHNPMNTNVQQNPMNPNPQQNLMNTSTQHNTLNLQQTSMHVQHTMNGQQNSLNSNSMNSQQMYMNQMTSQKLPVNTVNAQQQPININPQLNVGDCSPTSHQNSTTSLSAHHNLSSSTGNDQHKNLNLSQNCGTNMENMQHNSQTNSGNDQHSSSTNTVNPPLSNLSCTQENMQQVQENVRNGSEKTSVGIANDKDPALSNMPDSSYLDNSQQNPISNLQNPQNNKVDPQNQLGNSTSDQNVSTSVENQNNLYAGSVNSFTNNFSPFGNTNFGMQNQPMGPESQQTTMDSCNQNRSFSRNIQNEEIHSSEKVTELSSDTKPSLSWDPNKHHYCATESTDLMKCEPNVDLNSECKNKITSVVNISEAEKKLDSTGKDDSSEFEMPTKDENKTQKMELEGVSPIKLESNSAGVNVDESNSADEEKKNLDGLLNEADKETADAQNQVSCIDTSKIDCETKEASTGMYSDNAKKLCFVDGKQLVDIGTNPPRNNDPGIPYDWATELLKNYVPGSIANSAKMEVFFCILEESMALGDRLLVFSQSLFTLNLIEDFLQRSNVPGQEEKWARSINYYRLDGSTSALEREKLINEYNSNPNIHLFLVSTRAGSLGINLVGANRVVVFDASWNPCHDTQAVCRVYRYGQKKPCFVYRLVMDNCLEKKIYDRQINKQGMADRVVDECNPDAHLSIKDVTNLCWDKEEDSEVKDFSKEKDKYIDVVMQKVLDKFSSCLSKEPFQHESLLVDRKEKKLSQAEKRLAKRSYELEKQASINYNRPQYSYYPAGVGNTGGQSGLQIRAIRTDGGGTVMAKPIASVRPMQAELNSQMERGPGGQTRSTITTLNTGRSRWIPAEVWQRQGMSAQEMTLPLDVVIPTNSPDRASIVLKAGQRVMVLKSPKGIYMQLENGKIIAIRTAFKVGGAGKGSNVQEKAATEKEGEIKPSDLKKDFNISSNVASRTNTKVSNVLPFKNNSAITIIPKTTTLTPGRSTPNRPANKMITINRQETGLKPWNTSSSNEAQGKMNLLAKQRLMGAKVSQQPTGEARPYFHQQQGMRNKKMAVGGNQLTGMAKPFFHQELQKTKVGAGMGSVSVRNVNIPPPTSDDTSSGAENVSANDDKDDATMRDVDTDKFQSMEFQEARKYSRISDDVEQDSEMSSEDAMPIGKEDGNFTCATEEFSPQVRQDEQNSMANFQTLREKQNWQKGEKPGWQQGEKQGWQQGEKQGWQQGEKQGWQQGEKQGWQQGEKQGWQQGEKQGWQQREKPDWQQGEKPGWQQGEKPGWQQGEKSSWQQGEKPGWQQGEKSSWQQGEKPGWQQGEKPGWQQGEKPGWQQEQGEKSGWQQSEKSEWQQGEKSGWPQGEKQSWQQGEKPGWQQEEKPGWQQAEKPGWQQAEKPSLQQVDKSGWQQGEKPGWPQGEKPGWQQGEKSGWQQGEKPGWQQGEKSGWPQGEKPEWHQGEKPSWQQENESHNFNVEGRKYQCEDKNWDKPVQRNIDPVQSYQHGGNKNNFSPEKLEWQKKTKSPLSNKSTGKSFGEGNKSDANDKWASSHNLPPHSDQRNWNPQSKDNHKKGGYITDSSVGDHSNEWKTTRTQGTPGSYVSDGRHFTKETVEWKMDPNKRNTKFTGAAGDYSQNRNWSDQRNEYQNTQDMSAKNLGNSGEFLKSNESKNFHYDGSKLQKTTSEEQNFTQVNFGGASTNESRHSELLKSVSSGQTAGKEFPCGAVTVQKMEPAMHSPMLKSHHSNTASLKNYRHATFTQSTQRREVESNLDNTVTTSSSSADSPSGDHSVRPPSHGSDHYNRSPISAHETNKDVGIASNASYAYESRMQPDHMIRKVNEPNMNYNEDSLKMKHTSKVDSAYNYTPLMNEDVRSGENNRKSVAQSQQYSNINTTQTVSSSPVNKKGRGSKSTKQDNRSTMSFTAGYDSDHTTNVTSPQSKQFQNKPVSSEGLSLQHTQTVNQIVKRRSPQDPSKSPDTYSSPGYNHPHLGAPGYFGYGHQVMPPMQLPSTHVQDTGRVLSEHLSEDKGKPLELSSGSKKESNKSADARESKKESKPSQANMKDDAKSVASPGSASGSRSGNNSARSTPALPPASAADTASSHTSPAPATPANFSPYPGAAVPGSVSQTPFDSVLSAYPSTSPYNLSASSAGAAPSPFSAPAGSYGVPLRPPPTANSVTPYGTPAAYGYGAASTSQYDSDYARASMYSAFHRPEPHHFPAPPTDLGSPFLPSANPSPFGLSPHHATPAFPTNPGATPTSNYYPQNMYAANPYAARPAYTAGDPAYGVPYGTAAAGFSPFLNHLPGSMHQHPYAALSHPGSAAPAPPAAPQPTERPAQ
ncbi:uncharacterized protein LOC134533208 isoform X2 [Bacillus rossius redtenbacheri]|uniref:uncharacterized protein LOC134533208 isoform X2 n=1 Tax=Bacillus rossius redtenbacheri TaxID=93214 RepID=UPI002FDCF67C